MVDTGTLERLHTAIHQMTRVLANTADNIDTNPYVATAQDQLRDAYDYIESLRDAAESLVGWAQNVSEELEEGSAEDVYTIKDIFNALFSLKQSGSDLEQGGVTIAEIAAKLKRVAV